MRITSAISCRPAQLLFAVLCVFASASYSQQPAKVPDAVEGPLNDRTAVAQVSELWGTDGDRWTPQSRLPDFSFAGYHSGYDPLPDVPVRANVKDFGAKGDGVSDDTEAFLRALASVRDGAVFVPAGRYMITQVLKITRSNLALKGAGRDQTILYFPKPLAEMLGRAPEWAGLAGSGIWSWGGGVLWLEGREAAVRLTGVTAPARRGDTTLAVASTTGLSVGMTIRLVQYEPPDGSLGRHLHADYANAGEGVSPSVQGRLVDWGARVSAIAGTRMTLDRPLRVDVRPEWNPQLFSLSPSVQEVGLEDFTIEFPNSTYAGHHKEKGYNGIFMVGVHHSWVRNVTILDGDSGINIHNTDADRGVDTPVTASSISRWVTISGLRLANRWRNQSGAGHHDIVSSPNGETDVASWSRTATGHHGIALEGPQDCLITDFIIDNTWFVHDLTVDERACGNVFSRGKGRNINFDHHRSAPYENLFTQIDVGIGNRLWDSSGSRERGLHSAARSTLWNIKAASAPPVYPDWPLLNIVGMTRWPTRKTDRTWIEAIVPESLAPPNLYEAQLARRRELSTTGPTAATRE